MVIQVSMQEWKTIFKQDIKEKLDESKKEYDEYKKTNRIVFLQQAGNKLFSVIENWLMVKYNARVSSYQQLRQLVNNNKFDKTLLSKAAQLHYFYYQNIIRGEPEEFDDMYVEIYSIVKKKIDNLE